MIKKRDLKERLLSLANSYFKGDFSDLTGHQIIGRIQENRRWLNMAALTEKELEVLYFLSGQAAIIEMITKERRP
jgi:hypothetical protein